LNYLLILNKQVLNIQQHTRMKTNRIYRIKFDKLNKNNNLYFWHACCHIKANANTQPMEIFMSILSHLPLNPLRVAQLCCCMMTPVMMRA